MDYNKMIEAFDTAKTTVDPDWEIEVLENSIKVNNDQELIFIEECNEFMSAIDQLVAQGSILLKNPDIMNTDIDFNIMYKRVLMNTIEELADVAIAMGMISVKYKISCDTVPDVDYKSFSEGYCHIYNGIMITTNYLRHKIDESTYAYNINHEFAYIASFAKHVKKLMGLSDDIFNKMKNVKLARIETWYKKTE